MKEFIRNRTPSRALMAVPFLLFAACAQTVWQRADADPAAAAVDHEQCRQQAILSARRLASVDPQNLPRMIRSPGGEKSVVMPASPAARDPLLERDFLAHCLRAKGYSPAEIR